MSRDRFIDQFGRAILSGNAALFVGAGLSQAAGYPGWGRLLRPLQDRCDIPDDDDLPLVAEYIAVDHANGGRAALETHILREVEAIPPTPTDSHVAIEKLALKEIWTTNYDRLLETAVPNAAVISNEDDVHDIASHGRSIIKMHGSINASGRWDRPPVITRSDYEQYERDHPRMWTVLRSTYMSRSMLFLGFSFTDPNVDILLRLARTLNTAANDRHVAVMKPPTSSIGALRLHRLRVSDLENSGVQVCEIGDYDDIPALLADLAIRTRPPHLFVAGSSDISGATPEMDEASIGQWCTALASTLISETDWTIASLGGAAGWLVTRDSASARRSEGTYDPRRLAIHIRGKDLPDELPEQRVGTTVYSDLDRPDLVDRVLNNCRAMVAVRGGVRTTEEINWAVARRVGVVPIAASGGAALDYWEAHRGSPPDLGSRSTDSADWDRLNDADPMVTARAAKRLLDQAMYEH